MIYLKHINGESLHLLDASMTPQSYGHYYIEVDLLYRGQYGTFSKSITDMEVIDTARDLADNWEKKRRHLYDAIEFSIDEQVEFWVIDVDFELKTPPGEIAAYIESEIHLYPGGSWSIYEGPNGLIHSSMPKRMRGKEFYRLMTFKIDEYIPRDYHEILEIVNRCLEDRP